MTIQLAPTPFEPWASSRGYNVTPAEFPDPSRTYADPLTQEAFETWNAGASHVARIHWPGLPKLGWRCEAIHFQRCILWLCRSTSTFRFTVLKSQPG